MEKLGLRDRKHFSQEYLAARHGKWLYRNDHPRKTQRRLQKFVR